MKFSLKPIYNPWLAIVYQLPVQLFFMVWCPGFLGAFFPINSALLSWIPNELVILSPSVTFYIALPLILFPLYALTLARSRYQRTEYHFFARYLEMKLPSKKFVIMYEEIAEMELHYGGLQRKVGLGTIYIKLTPAPLATPTQHAPLVPESKRMLKYRGACNKAFFLSNLPDPERSYEKVAALVRNVKQATSQQ